MEQQYSAPGAAWAQAARTVLPGEPFDPPASSQVPGPRPAEQLPAPEPDVAPPTPTPWNYQPAPPPYGAPVYEPFTEQPVASSDFETLHEYDTLPAAAPPAWPADEPAPGEGFNPADPVALAEPLAPPPFAPASQSLPPLPPAPLEEEGHGTDGGKHQASRKGPDRRLLAVTLVAVLAGGGYVASTQLFKKSSSAATTPAATPTAPVAAPAAAVKYDFPATVAGLKLRTGAAADLQSRQLRLFAAQAYPTFGATVSIANYSSGSPAIVALSFHPGAARLASTYSAILSSVRKPATGNVVGAFRATAPGAAGGQMTCGGQRGTSPISYCVWLGKTSVGMTYITGSPKTQINESITRELRAYAEH